ncbi:MAG: hypothetical protein D6753_15900 [Planctomycetota bacterium]|nr:MAG: hypothetical protein D6753_15900 [Planctomycetota bacterium]
MAQQFDRGVPTGDPEQAFAWGQSSPPVVGPVPAQRQPADAADREPPVFIDRRSAEGGRAPGVERRQFGNSHRGLSDAGRELAQAVDRYKVQHGRRFINFDELLQIVESLGYRRS